MATNVIRYRHGGETRWGVLEGATVKPVAGEFATTRDFMLDAAGTVRSGDGVSDGGPPLSEVEVLCPITEDRQFLCQAINYRTHMLESGLDPDASPFNIFFRKASSCLAPADTDIVKPAHVEFLDPAGPHLTLVTREDLARFDSLRLQLSVNGETRQDSLASDMVHKPPASLTELSSFQSWQAGDFLATGTPGGTALRAPAKPLVMLSQIVSPARRQKLLRNVARKNTRRLQPGDLVETSVRTDDGEIDLGTQRNRVVAP